jgi:hypothetical protein
MINNVVGRARAIAGDAVTVGRRESTLTYAR